MSAEETESKPRTYGNWMKPEEKGILPGLGPLGTGIIFMVCIVLVLLVIKSEWIAAGCVTLAGVLLLWLVTHRDQHGKSAADKIIVRVGWWRSRRKKENVWRAGTLGYGRPGSVMLPGILGQVELAEATDATGVPFGVLFCPRQDTYTVVVNSSPSGEDLVDRDQIDRWVAMWGVFKADMADERHHRDPPREPAAAQAGGRPPAGPARGGGRVLHERAAGDRQDVSEGEHGCAGLPVLHVLGRPRQEEGGLDQKEAASGVPAGVRPEAAVSGAEGPGDRRWGVPPHVGAGAVPVREDRLRLAGQGPV
ncbi:MAG: hypothetical protein M3Z40_08770 [Bifidobacterium sp.]|nr:hypothetical protein [Bifidobacterium sp.]